MRTKQEQYFEEMLGYNIYKSISSATMLIDETSCIMFADLTLIQIRKIITIATTESIKTLKEYGIDINNISGKQKEIMNG